MALAVLRLLAIGLLGYAGYWAAKAAAERDRRRRDGAAGQDPGTVAAGKEAAQDASAMEDDLVVGASADPWAETNAGHPDESASDSLDHHPQPEDEAPRTPGA